MPLYVGREHGRRQFEGCAGTHGEVNNHQTIRLLGLLTQDQDVREARFCGPFADLLQAVLF